MKNKTILFFAIVVFPFMARTQSSIFSPYSRYGLGELSQNTFAHNAGMGGAFVALKPDSTMPIFINAGNPASYALIRLTTLEVGGTYLYSQFKGNNSTGLKKWAANFAYGALGFPVRNNGGACFGIMPYSTVGYDTKTYIEEPGVGWMEYQFKGEGGLNKAFIGYGVMPFHERLIKYRSKHFYIPDSVKTLTVKQYKRRGVGHKLLNDLSVGFNVNYIFGTIANTTKVIYPNSLNYNNTFRERILTLGDFTGNFGLQTGVTIDSVSKGDGHNRYLKEKVRLTFGYFMNLNNSLKASYTTGAYNYILNGGGQEILRDTVLYKTNVKGTVKLPIEQGFGIGIKKGERINFVADFAITGWENFKYLETVSELKNNYRVSAGINYVPEKYAAGRNAFPRKVNYRLGAGYQTGYIQLNKVLVTDYFVSAGVGLPVGISRLSSMVNISAQYGIMGSGDPSLIKQNYWRINFGFTFCDRWFQKFRYD